ncbi:DUF4230 domain-containing protein [Arcticibacterium luteifluviistationis]|uniref:DUF4230 domain-containing protein n=1 Tax=Arcticibacterium luteifluviistationis TaxID=1784714 RepID=A0A2Z4GE25_9BACT|nr:DUF4230 domain-containing protein [Arcticibacterium luteifluviistationis]AWV99434.1 DUF4230 domain-containing protein [Arcticibacterium luteifluviistationis]
MTKLIKLIGSLLIVAFITILAWELLIPKLSNPFKIKSIETNHSVILKEVKTMGNLELAAYYFNDIVEQKLPRDYLPDPKALLIIYGSASGCIDLTKIGDDDVYAIGDTTFVKLPKPYICHFKIDHSKSKIYDSDYAFMNEELLFGEAFKSAEKQLLKTAESSDLLKTAEENASKILVPLLEKISKNPVVIMK